MSRKTAREIAMKLVFSRLLGGEGDYTELLELSGIEERSTPEDQSFANDILQGIMDHSETIDQTIGEHSLSWSVDRIDCVDLSILRLAVYELLYSQNVPQSVCINEAVELAKVFGGEKSASFINGVLGGIVRAQDKPESQQ